MHLDVHFVAPIHVGAVLRGRPHTAPGTRSLLFMRMKWIFETGRAMSGQNWTQRNRRFSRAAESIDERYPDPDVQLERDAALSTAVQYMLGETTAAEVRERLNRACVEAMEALARVKIWGKALAKVDGLPTCGRSVLQAGHHVSGHASGCPLASV
ncbi:hypothetical protein R4P64_29255 [Rhodococcus sp. IEGM 1366]|uniref:hypothetical protein n=1 Tax=Rhodococcus sp. IEGM 1366 TaxID=3082223 RepID=UPI0029558894|nr:hypothetical protein [Rhodococcus sp. IEGM 1366]MDV8070628.1 hypothetical protein [Rhodococcus sp. IEGM 1366]